MTTIFFDKRKKRIVRSKEKRLNVGDHPVEVVVMENTVIQGRNEYPKILAMTSIAEIQANIDNVSNLVEEVGYYKERTSHMKETMRKERGEGKELKIKHDDTFYEFEKLK